jgi:methyl-accepting chemotaxis protein
VSETNHSDIARTKNARSLKNILIDPFVQVRLGLYSIFLALIFSCVVSAILYLNLSKFGEIVMTLTDVEDEIKALFVTYMADARWWLLLAILVFLILNIVVSIIFTHRLVGPAVAFNRQLNALLAGDYTSRVNLRKGDSFRDIAEKLNRLAEKLEAEKGSK